MILGFHYRGGGYQLLKVTTAEGVTTLILDYNYRGGDYLNFRLPLQRGRLPGRFRGLGGSCWDPRQLQGSTNHTNFLKTR